MRFQGGYPSSSAPASNSASSASKRTWIAIVVMSVMVLLSFVACVQGTDSSFDTLGGSEITMMGSDDDSGPVLTGGLSQPREIDPEVVAIVGALRPSILATLSSTTALGHLGLDVSNSMITPVAYRTQVVAGINYFVKVRITTHGQHVNYAIVRIFRPLPRQGEITVVSTRLVDEGASIDYI